MRLEEANIASVALEKALRCLLESIGVERVGGAEARVHVPERLHCSNLSVTDKLAVS